MRRETPTIIITVIVCTALILLILIAAKRLVERESDCGNLAGLERDECLARQARKNADSLLCRSIEDMLVRDICLRDALTKELLESRNETTVPPEIQCGRISQPHLAYQCLRRLRPPSNLSALSERTVPTSTASGTDACNRYSEYYGTICISVSAAGRAIKDLPAAESLCGNPDNEQNPECLMFVVWTRVMQGDIRDSQRRQYLLSLCGRIGDPVVSKECFSTVGEEMARLSPPLPPETLAGAINESPVVTYANFESVMALMRPEDRILLCAPFRGARQKLCYETLSLFTAEAAHHDPQVGILGCEVFPSEYREHCLLNLARSFGLIELDTVQQNIALCDDFKEQYRNMCFESLSLEIGIVLGGGGRTLEETIAVCLAFPEDLKDMCFDSFGEGLPWLAGISATPDICPTLDAPYAASCFSGISQMISLAYTDDLEGASQKCKELPFKFQQNCFALLSQQAIEQSEQDTQLAVHRCEQFPASFRDICLSSLQAFIEEHYGYDPDLKSEKCGLLPRKYQKTC